MNRILLTFALMTSFSFAARPIGPCAALIEDTTHARIGIDDTLKIIPGPRVANQIFSIAATYYDLSLDLDRADTSKIAKLIARKDVPEASVKQILDTGNLASLAELLPPQVRQKLGQHDTAMCYEAAFSFNDPNYKHLTNFMPYLRSRYYPLGTRGESLRYGDLIVMWRQHPDRKRFFTQHAAIYLGGDFLYHKFGPDRRAAYEFITFESLVAYYQVTMAAALQGARKADEYTLPFHFEYMRYDPHLSREAWKVRAIQKSIDFHSGNN